MQPVACKAPLRPSNTNLPLKAPRRGSRFTQQHGRAMLLSGMLLCAAVMILRPCAGRLATAAAHSTQHIRGEEDARVVAAVSASQAAGAGASVHTALSPVLDELGKTYMHGPGARLWIVSPPADWEAC